MSMGERMGMRGPQRLLQGKSMHLSSGLAYDRRQPEIAMRGEDLAKRMWVALKMKEMVPTEAVWCI